MLLHCFRPALSTDPSHAPALQVTASAFLSITLSCPIFQARDVQKTDEGCFRPLQMENFRRNGNFSLRLVLLWMRLVEDVCNKFGSFRKLLIESLSAEENACLLGSTSKELDAGTHVLFWCSLMDNAWLGNSCRRNPNGPTLMPGFHHSFFQGMVSKVKVRAGTHIFVRWRQNGRTIYSTCLFRRSSNCTGSSKFYSNRTTKYNSYNAACVCFLLVCMSESFYRLHTLPFRLVNILELLICYDVLTQSLIVGI